MSTDAQRHSITTSGQEIAVRVEDLQAVATLHARHLGRQFMLTRPDIEDVEQEVLLVLLQRWRFFDPARGPGSGALTR